MAKYVRTKYVRTKDLVYKVLNMKIYCGKKFYYAGGEMAIPDDKVIKEADNIEELCDMYVYVDKDKMPCVAGLRINTKQYKLYADFCLVNHIDLYGAIWTEGGLIYVAKMNDKGELELI